MKVGKGEFLEILDFLMCKTKYNLNCFMSFGFSQFSLQNLMESYIIGQLHLFSCVYEILTCIGILPLEH